MEFDQLPGETVEAGTGEHLTDDEDDESDEDLLEETPDFLQDAPEGEDLWFEQGRRRTSTSTTDGPGAPRSASSSAHGPWPHRLLRP